eukprot:scaffold126020_cov66-Phaeocystis_antarctica.AAC.2
MPALSRVAIGAFGGGGQEVDVLPLRPRQSARELVVRLVRRHGLVIYHEVVRVDSANDGRHRIGLREIDGRLDTGDELSLALLRLRDIGRLVDRGVLVAE